MNKLHASLFSLFSVATFLCSASEQPITQYDEKQLSTIKIFDKKVNFSEQQCHENYTHFIKNANALQETFKNQHNFPLVNNELRFMMAENLKPIIKHTDFINRLRRHLTQTPHQQSHRLNYLNTIQGTLRNINELTITTEEIEQYIMVIGDIVPRPMQNLHNPIDQLTQQIFDEITEENEQCARLFPTPLDKEASEQNKKTVDCLAEFLKITQQEKITKKQKKQAKQIAELQATIDEFPTMKLPPLVTDTMTDAEIEAIIAQHDKFFKSEATRKTPYIIAGAIAILIAYCCKLHHKLADFISSK